MKKDEHPTGRDRYEMTMANWGSQVLKPVSDKKIKVEEISKEKRIHFERIFAMFSEITDAIDNLRLCKEFIKGAPPRRKGVLVDKYLNYHITFYLYEAYTLKERLVNYAKIIERIQKKHDPSNHLPTLIPKLVNTVENILKPLVLARGGHVHDRSFEDSDMRRLATFAFVSRYNNEFSDYARDEYFWSKTKWARKLTENQKEIEKLLNLYCDTIFKIINPEKSPILKFAIPEC